MNNEQAIMEQLDHLGKEIAVLTDSAKSLRELRDDLSPRVNETVQALITQLAELEADFQAEDLVSLIKNMLRSVRNLTWSLDQLKNLIDFMRTVEPLLKSAVPQTIFYLDQLERGGVFQVFSHMMGVLEKIADTYTPEDIEQISDGLVNLVGVAKKLTAPEALNLLDKMAEVPARVDLSQAKEVGPFGMIFALGNPEVKQGMGVMLELTKGLALLKNGSPAPAGEISPTQDTDEPTPETEDK